MRKTLSILVMAFALFIGNYGAFTPKISAQCGCGCAMECAGRCGANCDGCTVSEAVEKGAECCRGAAAATGDLPACPVGTAS